MAVPLGLGVAADGLGLSDKGVEHGGRALEHWMEGKMPVISTVGVEPAAVKAVGILENSRDDATGEVGMGGAACVFPNGSLHDGALVVGKGVLVPKGGVFREFCLCGVDCVGGTLGVGATCEVVDERGAEGEEPIARRCLRTVGDKGGGGHYAIDVLIAVHIGLWGVEILFLEVEVVDVHTDVVKCVYYLLAQRGLGKF